MIGELRDRGDNEGATQGVAARVAARLHTFWAGSWEALMRDTTVDSREGDGSMCQDAQTTRRARGLLMQEELGRAAAAAWGPAAVRTPEDVVEAFRTQTRGCGLDPLATAPQPEDARLGQQLRDDVATQLQASWKQFPRGAGAGPQGDRFEHWMPVAATPTRGWATARALANLAGGSVPDEALSLALAGRLVGLTNRTGGTRVIACGGVPRRMVGRAVCKVRAGAIADAVGDLQYGVGRTAGAEALQKVLTAKAESAPSYAFLSLDIHSAFGRVRRSSMLAAVAQRCPPLLQLAQQWYRRRSVHVARGQGDPSAFVSQDVGLDQGCPLSPALFAITLAGPLEALSAWLRGRDPLTGAYAYLDDVYLVVPLTLVRETLQQAAALVGALGLDFHEDEARVWFPQGPPVGLEPVLAARLAKALPCLGSHLSFVRPRAAEGLDEDDNRDVPVGADDVSSPQTAAARLQEYVAALGQLRNAGLEVQHVFTLLHTYVGGAVTHLQRSRAAGSLSWRPFDDDVVKAVAALLGGDLRPEGRALLFLPRKLGGAGFSSAERTADAAWAASWEASREAVLADQGVATDAHMVARAPHLMAVRDAVRQRLVEAGAPPSGDRQRDLVQLMVQRARRTLMESLRDDTDGSILVRSGGAEGGDWLRPPLRRDRLMSDDLYIVALRRRLLFFDPGGAGGGGGLLQHGQAESPPLWRPLPSAVRRPRRVLRRGVGVREAAQRRAGRPRLLVVGGARGGDGDKGAARGWLGSGKCRRHHTCRLGHSCAVPGPAGCGRCQHYRGHV